jgi:hypothetical protein
VSEVIGSSILTVYIATIRLHRTVAEEPDGNAVGPKSRVHTARVLHNSCTAPSILRLIHSPFRDNELPEVVEVVLTCDAEREFDSRTKKATRVGRKFLAFCLAVIVVLPSSTH